jgi:hypothetical protein
MNETRAFEMVLQTISTGLVGKIIIDKGLDEDAAMESLYSSKLYAMLEKEDTKLWHYSVPMLYDLHNEELTTGSFIIHEQ